MEPGPEPGAAPVDMMGRVWDVFVFRASGLTVLRMIRGNVSKMVGGTTRVDIARSREKMKCEVIVRV